MYDLVIVGGGPAGAAAAVYAARKRLKTIFITDEWGGQSNVSEEIQNWIGSRAISGADLAKNLREHVEAHVGDSLTVVSPMRAAKIEPKDDRVILTTQKGEVYETKAALITSGARRRKLGIPGAEAYDQKGLTYCASCDGPLFADKDVVVIGGGNAGFETAAQLLAYCKSVLLLHRSDEFKADAVTIEKVLAHTNMRAVKNAQPLEVIGDKFVTGLRWKDAQTGKEELSPVEGVFVEIGLLPNTEWIGDTLKKNTIGQLVVDPRTQQASHPRVWAAGDVTDGLYHQNNIAAGDAVKALEDIYMAVHRDT